MSDVRSIVPTAFGHGRTVYDPVLARKPGAPQNGAPLKLRVLPAALERVRCKLRASLAVIARWSTSGVRC